MMADRVCDPVTNFGRNRSFTPGERVVSRDKEELLDAMRKHRGRRIHAMGRLQLWSEAPVAPDVLIDLSDFNDVTIHEGDAPWADVGCRLPPLPRPPIQNTRASSE